MVSASIFVAIELNITVGSVFCKSLTVTSAINCVGNTEYLMNIHKISRHIVKIYFGLPFPRSC